MEFIEILKDWAPTIALIAAGVTTVFLLIILALREFFGWFLRVSEIREQLILMQRQLDRIENTNYSRVSSENSFEISETKDRAKFPLKSPDLITRSMT